MAVMVLSCSTVTASATGIGDVFNAEWYANAYEDLYEAFGYNEEKLLEHYMTFGINEHRACSPVFDVVKYREEYPDLGAAFGDNWDAYVEHYFTFGIDEHRISGGTFDPIAYADAYPDVKAACGYDVNLLIQHFLTFGIAEGRTAGVTIETEPVVETPAAPAPTPAPAPSSDSSSGSSSSSDSSSSSESSEAPKGYTQREEAGEGETEYSYAICEYDADGVLQSRTEYNEQGEKLFEYTDYTFYESGNVKTETLYIVAEGITVKTVFRDKFDDEQRPMLEKVVDSGSSDGGTWERTSQYDENGKLTSMEETYKNNDGSSGTTTYDITEPDKPVPKSGTYQESDSEGGGYVELTYSRVQDEKGNYLPFKETYYGVDPDEGKDIIVVTEYAYSSEGQEASKTVTVYDANNKDEIAEENKTREEKWENGSLKESIDYYTYTDDDGTKVECKEVGTSFSNDNKIITATRYERKEGGTYAEVATVTYSYDKQGNVTEEVKEVNETDNGNTGSNAPGSGSTDSGSSGGDGTGSSDTDGNTGSDGTGNDSTAGEDQSQSNGAAENEVNSETDTNTTDNETSTETPSA